MVPVIGICDYTMEIEDQKEKGMKVIAVKNRNLNLLELFILFTIGTGFCNGVFFAMGYRIHTNTETGEDGPLVKEYFPMPLFLAVVVTTFLTGYIIYFRLWLEDCDKIVDQKCPSRWVYAVFAMVFYVITTVITAIITVLLTAKV